MPNRSHSSRQTPLLAPHPSQSSSKFVASGFESIEVFDKEHLQSFSIHQSPMVRLYDIDSTLEIPRDVADGYLILLSGGLNSASAIRQQRNKKKVSSAPTPGGEPSAQTFNSLSPEEINAIQLAYFALTDGNAIDVLFGVKSMGGSRRNKYTSEKAFKAADDAKRALMDATVASDAIRLLAVETYAKCFEVLIKYHLELDKIGFITWCVRHQKIRDSTVKQIEELFRALEEGVASSS